MKAAAQQGFSSRTVAAWRAANLLWVVAGLILVGYGLLAFNAGTKVSPLNNDGSQSLARVEHIIEQADRGVAMQDSEEARAVIPFWMNLIARIESSQYVHGSDSLMEAERHYYAMAEKKRHVLSTHMLLGVVLMATGFLQFWPAFRRKHRTAHRILGVVYGLTAVTSMSMSSYYLLHTEVADVYSQFAFFSGLWALVVLSLFSLSMATWSLLRRDIAAHLGWQALAFGCFLTAPTQRILWISLSPFSGGATFNEVNIAVNVLLLPLSFFIGYVLFVANRNSSPAKPAAATLSAAPAWQRWTLIALALGMGVLSASLLLTNGLSGSSITKSVAMASAAQAHDASALGPLGLLAFACLIATMIAGIRLLASPKGVSAGTRATIASGLLASMALLALGYSIGMPSHAHSVAGSAYTFNGLLMLVVVAWGAYYVRANDPAKAREICWFIVLLSMSPALTYAFMYFFDAIDLVPSPFDEKGHGYQLAAALGLILPTIAAHLRAVYSQETRRYAVN